MYLVYLLKCENLTYTGMTNDFFRRWRQHIGDLKGGAKYTTRKGKDWYPILIIDGLRELGFVYAPADLPLYVPLNITNIHFGILVSIKIKLPP